uniref:Uncharacterized protein n=1 Tax=Onchocerca volvulus TaxID=6282 RepID=A0A8R1TVG8_ONCVO
MQRAKTKHAKSNKNLDVRNAEATAVLITAALEVTLLLIADPRNFQFSNRNLFRLFPATYFVEQPFFNWDNNHVASHPSSCSIHLSRSSTKISRHQPQVLQDSDVVLLLASSLAFSFHCP